MPTITTKGGTTIYYKDWGSGEPLFFHHGWPLSADDWDDVLPRARLSCDCSRQAGHGAQLKPTQATKWTPNVAQYGKGRVSKAVLISAVPPIMVKSDKNPGGTPIEVFDQIRQGTGYNRAQFYQDITLPFYGYNRPGATISQGVRDN